MRDPELLVYVGQNAPFEAAVAGIHPYINHESLAYPVLHGGGIPADCDLLLINALDGTYINRWA